MKKPNRSGAARLGKRETFLSRWERLCWERTDTAASSWLYRLEDNRVSCTVPAPYSLKQVVNAISEQAQEPIRIELLSPQLQAPVLPRGKTVFGSAWDEIDRIARNYPNMYWWISEHRLTMDTVVPAAPPADFDQIAGRLVFEMRKRYPEQSRLSADQHFKIAAQLDQQKRFKPLDVLSKKKSEELAKWNQKYGNRAILSFSQAVDAKQPKWIRREILRRLYRAEEKFNR
jgi:hypothetical protein